MVVHLSDDLVIKVPKEFSFKENIELYVAVSK